MGILFLSPERVQEVHWSTRFGFSLERGVIQAAAANAGFTLIELR